MTKILPVPAPPLNTARLRFTTDQSWIGKAIRFDTSGAVSHVEAVMADGTIIGSYLRTGVTRQPNQYDKTANLQIFVDCPMSAAVYADWVSGLKSSLGAPYDLGAIVGFITHINLHAKNALICSALQIDMLNIGWWGGKTFSTAYQDVSPVILLLMLQADPRAIVYPTQILGQ
jgi:hypothetical protein